MTAKKYTKKPVQIEALLYTGDTESALVREEVVSS